MAGTLLHIAASPRGEASNSRKYGSRLAEGLCAALDLARIERDLAASPLPPLAAAFAEASLMPESTRTASHRTALLVSERLIAELEQAAIVVIDTPMHNFTVPASLKLWIDHVVRPERTFRSTPQGKIGLLRDRPVFAIVASGGPLAGNGAQHDYLVPYLRYIFATMGIGDFRALTLDRLRRGEAEIASRDAMAQAWIAQQIERD